MEGSFSFRYWRQTPEHCSREKPMQSGKDSRPNTHSDPNRIRARVLEVEGNARYHYANLVVLPVSLHCRRKASSPTLQLTLFCTVCCQAMPLYVLRSSLHLLFCRPLFLVQFFGVQLAVLHAHLLPCPLARWPAHLHFFDLIVVITSCTLGSFLTPT